MLKKILYVLLAALVIIQFFRPQRNQSTGPYPNDITTKFAMNDTVMGALKTACFDCHSNNTTYPWYANVQPVAWWLQGHINDGKKHLNFSEFASYKTKRQHKKLEEIGKAVTEGWMPLDSYTWMHKNVRLSAEQKTAIKKWVDESLAKLPPAEPEPKDEK
ncbi:MAG: heme-binding domain-containing protein [Chitinophagaceae bacterium]|nr:heme-binding domain-containing protein [Chitinophagaceae bacterium]